MPSIIVFDVRKVTINNSRNGNDIGNSLHPLPQDIVGNAKRLEKARSFIDKLHQPLVGNADDGIHALAQLRQTLLRLHHAALAFEGEGLGNHRHGERAQLARQAGDDGSAPRPRSPAQAGGDKHHVRAFQGFDDLFRVLQSRPPADFRVASRTQSLGQLGAQLNLQWGIGSLERLRVGIGHQKVHAFHVGGDHAVDRIAPASPDADHLDFGAVAQFIRKIHPEVAQAGSLAHDGSPSIDDWIDLSIATIIVHQQTFLNRSDRPNRTIVIDPFLNAYSRSFPKAPWTPWRHASSAGGTRESPSLPRLQTPGQGACLPWPPSPVGIATRTGIPKTGSAKRRQTAELGSSTGQNHSRPQLLLASRAANFRPNQLQQFRRARLNDLTQHGITHHAGRPFPHTRDLQQGVCGLGGVALAPGLFHLFRFRDGRAQPHGNIIGEVFAAHGNDRGVPHDARVINNQIRGAAPNVHQRHTQLTLIGREASLTGSERLKNRVLHHHPGVVHRRHHVLRSGGGRRHQVHIHFQAAPTIPTGSRMPSWASSKNFAEALAEAGDPPAE